MKGQTEQGRRFSEVIKEKKVNQKKFAADIGVRPQSIQHWKRRGVSAKFAPLVAGKLGVPVGEISALAEEEGKPVVVSIGVAEEVNMGCRVEAEVIKAKDRAVYEALTDKAQLAAVLGIGEAVQPRDAIVIAEYFLARAKAGLPEN